MAIDYSDWHSDDLREELEEKEELLGERQDEQEWEGFGPDGIDASTKNSIAAIRAELNRRATHGEEEDDEDGDGANFDEY